jgi:hypothetical protein
MRHKERAFEHVACDKERDAEDVLKLPLCDGDRHTLFGMYGKEKVEGEHLLSTFQKSLWVNKVVRKDQRDSIYALYGLVHHYRNVGVPWLLCSPQACKYPLEFGRCTKKMIAKMQESHPILVNWCPKEAHKFVQWLGFRVTTLQHISCYNPNLVYHYVLKER